LRSSLVPAPGQRTLIEQQRTPTPRGVICSLATGRHRELLAESAPTLAAYGQRHGWDVLLSSESPQGARPPSWAKVVLVRDLLSRYPFVFWVDADALIVDLAPDLLDAARVGDDAADIWFARHPQERDPDATVLNAGVFLARSALFTDALLEAMWNAEEFIDHNWWENAALLNLLGYSLQPPFAQHTVTPWNARIGSLDLAWNSVPGYCESPAPVVNHHARSDHDDFGLRLASMAADRVATEARFPNDFAGLRPRRQWRARRSW
jgi:hypothetical protein